MSQNGRRKGPRKGAQGAPRGTPATIIPPMLESNPRLHRVIRYKSVGGTSTVYRNCLLSLISGSSTSATARVALLNSVRIKKIRMWSLDPNPTSMQELSITWASPEGPASTVSRLGNVSFPAYIDTKPPAGSFARAWQTHQSTSGAESDNLFFVSAVGDYVLDIHFDCVFEGVGVSPAATLVGTATSPGVYYHHLDCLNSAGSGGGSQLLVPVAYTVDLLTSRTP